MGQPINEEEEECTFVPKINNGRLTPNGYLTKWNSPTTNGNKRK